MHMRLCMRSYATVQKLLYHETIANLSWVLHEHRAGCRCRPPFLLSRLYQSPDAVCWRNPSKSTLAHHAVAAAVSHKHHLIIRVGAGLIQFVYKSHSRLAMELTLDNILVRHGFCGLFSNNWFHKNKLDQMLCKLDSFQYARLFQKNPILL